MRGISEALEQELENDGMYLEEVLSLLKSSITNLAESQGKTLNLTYEYQKNFYTSSHYALLSIFRNLFVNALEASKTDTVNLSVTEVIEDGQAIFTVTDDGPGIPAEYIGEVFKTGFSTKINFQTGEVSRGLGLNLVQDLVEGELHGTIGLTSVPGRTTVRSGNASRRKCPSSALTSMEVIGYVLSFLLVNTLNVKFFP